jgi:hypothetical protein
LTASLPRHPSFAIIRLLRITTFALALAYLR